MNPRLSSSLVPGFGLGITTRLGIPLLLAGLLCGCNPRQNLQTLIQSGAQPEKLAGDFSFTEGPAADSDGNVFFTDQPNDRIMRWSVPGELSVFMQPCGRSNGLYFDMQGNLWACADEKNELWRIDPNGMVTVMVSTYLGKPLNGPNDLWIRPDGGVYFTDPYYQRPWWDHTVMPQECQGVYFLNPADKSLALVAGDLVRPNGIIGTPDGKILYVADIGDNKTWQYGINQDGSLTGKTLFCNLGSDGMTIDARGNLYLTGQGVTVFNRKGRMIGNIPVTENWTANVCFGGPDRTDLFITASTGLYRLRLRF